MLTFVGRRLLSLVPVLLVVSVVIFSIIHLTPGDPARAMLGPDAAQDQVDALRERLGLNAPLPMQFLDWFTGIFRGDFGDSLFLRKPVLQAISDNAMPTLWLAVLAMVVALGLSIPLGTLAARHRGSLIDRVVTGISLIGLSVPSFVLGLVLVIVFAVWLRAVPAAGYFDPLKDFGRGLTSLALPAVALGTIVSAQLVRTTRASVLDVLGAEYIDSARSRGVGETRLLFTHTLKNAGLPILTLIGLTFGTLVTGAAVTETIFNIPGLGALLVQAIARRDYAVIQGVVLFVTLVYLVINLVIDILYGAIDPRVRVSARGGK
ncbi:ABC transporter permease [Lentzea sp. JNUCC 0626]|uniref:ABC transporter permease n=1 Tax=Lentzea sp. JNUCC 0626 TaxID=3367513 RepID=UPI003748125F